MPATDDVIEVSAGPKGLKRTYWCEGIHTATVYFMAGRWWVRCYYGPDEYNQHDCGTPNSGDHIAIRHTLRLTRQPA